MFRVRAGQRGCPIGVHRTEHVVVREEMGEAQFLDGSPDPADRVRITSELDLRIDDTDLHGFSLSLATAGGVP